MTTQSSTLGFRIPYIRSVLSALAALLFMTGISVAAQPDGIEREYRWSYGGRTWTLTYVFCESSYRFFRMLPRTLDYADYGVYASDMRDDVDLSGLVAAIEQLAYTAGLDAWERLNLIISFAQAIPYVTEEGEYPRYPLETLIEMEADCEDASILAAALLQQMGFDTILLAFLEEHHMAVGVRVRPPATDGQTYYTWNGGVYYYLEPTSIGWKIGQKPERYSSLPVIVPPTSTLASTR